MEVYWRERKAGQRLVLHAEDGEESEVGGVRQTSRGFDAFAKTLGYAPGQAMRDFTTIEEAKAFVESFQPWEIHDGATGLSVDSVVRPQPSEGEAQSDTPSPQAQADAPGEGTTDSGEVEPGQAPEEPPDAAWAPADPSGAKHWWQFWRRS